MYCALCPSDSSSKKFCHRGNVWIIADISASKAGVGINPFVYLSGSCIGPASDCLRYAGNAQKNGLQVPILTAILGFTAIAEVSFVLHPRSRFGIHHYSLVFMV